MSQISVTLSPSPEPLTTDDIQTKQFDLHFNTYLVQVVIDVIVITITNSNSNSVTYRALHLVDIKESGNLKQKIYLSIKRLKDGRFVTATPV